MVAARDSGREAQNPAYRPTRPPPSKVQVQGLAPRVEACGMTKARA